MKLFNIFLFAILIFGFSGCFDKDDKTKKFYGNVDVRTVSLAYRVSGRIDEVYVDEGQKVKEGEILAKLDDSLYIQYVKQIDAKIDMQKALISKLEKGYREEEIKKAKEKLLESEVRKNQLQKNFQRVEKLFKSGSISAQKYDDAKAEFEMSEATYMYAKDSYDMLEKGYEKEDIISAKANLASLQAQKNIYNINLQDTKLISPTNGTIITRIYEKGSIINPSQSVFEIAKDDEYWVRSYISEKYLGIIKIGQKVDIFTDSNKKFQGRVSFISPIAEFTPKTVQTEELRTDLVYRIRIIIDNFDDTLKQGMPVTITFPDIVFS